MTIPGLVTLAAAGLVVALLVATASAGARATCAPAARVAIAPRLIAPCDGATVAAHHAITFTVVDHDPAAVGDAPYLNLQIGRQVVDRHLRANHDGNGIFVQMTAVRGRRDTWTYTAARQTYPTWWDNRPGTYYVQALQVDAHVPSGIVYGPITTVRVR